MMSRTGWLVASSRGCGPHEEALQPRSDVVGIEVTTKSFIRGIRGIPALGLAVEKIDQTRRSLDRIVERQIPTLDAVIEEL